MHLYFAFKELDADNEWPRKCLQFTFNNWIEQLRRWQIDLIAEEWDELILHYLKYVQVSDTKGFYKLSTFDYNEENINLSCAILSDIVEIFRLNENDIDDGYFKWSKSFYSVMEKTILDDVEITRRAYDGITVIYFYLSGPIQTELYTHSNNNA